ncbi:MAG: adenylate/guanylate cyclase domain-containing protein [Bacteroidota bacterium]
MRSASLFRRHAGLLLVGGGVHALTALPCLAVAPGSFDLAGALGVAAVGGGISAAVLAELAVLRFLYAPLRRMDGLGSDRLYAQNPDLNRGIVRLVNLPLVSAFRAVLVRGGVFALTAQQVLAHGDPAWAEVFTPPMAGAFWLLHLLVAPLPGAVLELYGLPSLIEEAYEELLPYRTSLLLRWKKRVLSVPTPMRTLYFILALGVGPLAAVALIRSVISPSAVAILLAGTGSAAAAVCFIMLRSTLQGVESLEEVMRRIGAHRPPGNTPLVGGDEFTRMADGLERTAAALKERAFIQETFGKSVPRAVVDAALRSGVQLRGERRQVAVMLTDIHDFRSRLEADAPAEVIGLLNRYLQAVIASSQHFTGTIDKVVGDRVLVVFGAPVTLDAPVDRALFAASEIRRDLGKLNRRLQKTGGTPLQVSISIHYGGVVAGHIGTPERWEYSVVGDAVTEIHLLAQAARRRGPGTMVSAPARERASATFVFGDPLPEEVETRGRSIALFPLEEAEPAP